MLDKVKNDVIDIDSFKTIEPQGSIRRQRSISTVTVSQHTIYISKQLTKELGIKENNYRCAQVAVNEKGQVLISFSTNFLSSASVSVNVPQNGNRGAQITQKGIQRELNRFSFIDLDKYNYVYRPLRVQGKQIIIDLCEPMNYKASKAQKNAGDGRRKN